MRQISLNWLSVHQSKCVLCWNLKGGMGNESRLAILRFNRVQVRLSWVIPPVALHSCVAGLA
jgi:hypothetical protein